MAVKTTRRLVELLRYRFIDAGSRPSIITHTTPAFGPSRATQPISRPVNVNVAVSFASVVTARLPPNAFERLTICQPLLSATFSSSSCAVDSHVGTDVAQSPAVFVWSTARTRYEITDQAAWLDVTDRVSGLGNGTAVHVPLSRLTCSS